MAENPLATDEFKDKLGVEWDLGVYEVEKGMIRRFAQAIDDPNPLWHDGEYARQSQYGGIVAPPTFILTVGYEEFEDQMVEPLGARLSGSTKLESYQPVRPGDRITVTCKMVDMRQRQGKRMGEMVFVTFESTYKNQRQELVAKSYQTLICYQPEGARHD